MIDLSTRYLGLDLRTPIVASASPLNGELATAREVEGAGASAIVMPSLFEEEILNEEIELNRALEAGSDHFAEALDYFPNVGSFANVSDRYLALIESLKEQSSVPIIASLNATSAGGWARHAALIEQAGADALELNLYHVSADPERTAVDMQSADLDIVRAARGTPSVSRSRSSSAPTTRQWRTSPGTSSTPVPTGSCSSTASTNPTSISTRSRWSTEWS